MISLFSGFGKMLDHGLDKALSPHAGKDYGNAVGVAGAIFVSALAIILLAAAMGFKGSQIEPPKYFVVYPGKKPASLPVLQMPVLSATKVQAWTDRALRETYTFNFNNLNSRMARASEYYTPEAWAALQLSLERSKFLPNVRNKRLVVWSTAIEPTTIVKSSKVGGRLVWVVEAPVMFSFIGGEKPVYDTVIFKVIVQQVPTTDDPEGLVIASAKTFPYRH